MSCTDPIADALTVIRNGLRVGKQSVSFPHSRIKEALCQALVDEGYLVRCDILDTKPARTIRVGLKYTDESEPVMRTIKRISKPGCRRYMSFDDIKKPVINGFGVRIISTSRGVLSDRVCRAQKIGGEVLCEIC